MTTTQDWEQWQGSWRAESMSGVQLDALIAKTARARRAVAATRILSGVAAAIALLVVAAALRHAGNAFERALGLVVAVGIIGTWLLDARNHGHALDRVESGPDEYANVRRELCARRIRFAYLGWIVVALDFVFLIPWWIGGVKIHGFGFDLMHIESTWGPIGMMLGFVVWTVRLRKRSLAERGRLATRARGGASS
jgi:NADH:ubiquinone oxidoreductase subunit 3 (subunit A)